MTEPATGAKTPPSRSSSGETRLNEHQQTEVPQEKSGFSAGHHHITRTVSHKSIPVTYFAGDGELQRQVTRQETGISTHPNADDFDFEQHLRHILRKADKEGVKRRNLGGQSSSSLFFFVLDPPPVPRSARTSAEPFLPTFPMLCSHLQGPHRQGHRQRSLVWLVAHRRDPKHPGHSQGDQGRHAPQGQGHPRFVHWNRQVRCSSWFMLS